MRLVVPLPYPGGVYPGVTPLIPRWCIPGCYTSLIPGGVYPGYTSLLTQVVYTRVNTSLYASLVCIPVMPPYMPPWCVYAGYVLPSVHPYHPFHCWSML